MHGLDDVLVAVELALQSGRVSADHVLNVLARLKEPEAVHSLKFPDRMPVGFQPLFDT